MRRFVLSSGCGSPLSLSDILFLSWSPHWYLFSCCICGIVDSNYRCIDTQVVIVVYSQLVRLTSLEFYFTLTLLLKKIPLGTLSPSLLQSIKDKPKGSLKRVKALCALLKSSYTGEIWALSSESTALCDLVAYICRQYWRGSTQRYQTSLRGVLRTQENLRAWS